MLQLVDGPSGVTLGGALVGQNVGFKTHQMVPCYPKNISIDQLVLSFHLCLKYQLSYVNVHKMDM